MKEDALIFLKRKVNQRFTIRQLGHELDIPKHRQKDLKAVLRELISEGKVILDRDQHYTVRDEKRVLKGKLKLHPEGFGFFVPESRTKADVFIPQRHTGFAMHGDEVLVESYRNPRDGRYEGRVIQVVVRVNKVVVGTLGCFGKQNFVRFKDKRLGLEEIYIPKKHLKAASSGDLVVVRILQYPGYRIGAIGEIENVIGEDFDERSLVDAILIRYDIPKSFPNVLNKDLSRLPDEVSLSFPRDRVDLTKLPLITIDGATAKDFDDAVYVAKHGRSYILYVCIADVSEYVLPGSALDQEAYHRSTSTYLPDQCLPMLPEKLSNGLCSLNPFLPRLTLTAEIHYNQNFEFVQVRYYKSVIRSQKRATYDEVEAYLDGTGGEDFSHEVKQSLDHMKLLAEALLAQSKERGAMGFDLPEAQIMFDSQGQVTSIQKQQRFFSHKLIEQFMIAANVAVAQFFSLSKLPLLYRVHDRPDPFKIETFRQFVRNLGLHHHLDGFRFSDFFLKIPNHPLESFLQSVFLRSLKQARYSPDNVGHFGLTLEDYAHFTSPIRRYPDLTVHRQLKSLMKKIPDGILHLTQKDLDHPRRSDAQTLYSDQELVRMGNHCSDRERDAMEAERGIVDLKRAFFMREFISEKFFGVVTRVNKYGISVELDPYFVEGRLALKSLKDDYYIFDEKKIHLTGRRTKHRIQIGDRIWVQIADVNLENAQVEVIPCEDVSLGKRPQKGKRRHKRRK